MSRHKSAVKQARHSLQRRAINRSSRTRLRTTVKATRTLIAEGQIDAAKASLPGVYSELDRMSRRGILHRNAAARLKSRLTTKIASASPAKS